MNTTVTASELARLGADANTDVEPIQDRLRSRTPIQQIFSFPVVLAFGLAVIALMTVRERFNDPDLWWHLRFGQIIWSTHSIPLGDLFSFTLKGHEWIPQEWLSEVFMYLTWKLAGFTGLMLLVSVLASGVAIGGYALCATYSANVKAAFLGGLVTWFFSTIGLGIRPQLIGYILLISELLILHRGRRSPAWLFALPPLFALWVNCHSSFIFGIFVLSVFLFFSFLNFQGELFSSEPWEQRPRRVLAIAFVLSLAALFLNPIGPRLVWHPFDEMLNEPVNLSGISEWQPLDFDNLRAFLSLAVFALILFLPALRHTRLWLSELLLVTVAFTFALRHRRMLFVFGILVAPVLCRLLASAWEQYESQRDRPWINALCIAVSMAALYLAFPDARNIQNQITKNNPVKALQFIERSHLRGRMLNLYMWGGYLVWAAPEHKVFIDGRADPYDHSGVMADYLKWVRVETNPNELLEKYHIDFCLLSRTSHPSYVLPFLPGWNTVYLDEAAVIFERAPRGR